MTIMTQIFTFFQTFFAEAAAFNEFYARGLAYIGAGICCLAPAMSCLGEGMAAAKACESIGRQPEASGKILVTMLVGQAVTETGALYGFVMAIMLLSK